MAAHENCEEEGATLPSGEAREKSGLRHSLCEVIESISYRARTDEDLMRFAGRGDERAFDEVVRRHRGRIYALATGMLDDSQAADVLRDAFVSAYHDREAPQSRTDVKAWLYVHAARALLERFKARHPKGHPAIVPSERLA